MDDEQVTRAIIAALWPKLHAAEWGPVTTRDLNDYGNRPHYRAIATATIPNTPARDAKISTTRKLAIIATTTNEPILRVLLTESAYARALDSMTDTEHQAHQASLSGYRLPPYRWTTSRGQQYLATRQEGWDHTWSRYARDALRKVAQHAVTWSASDAAATHVVCAEQLASAT